MTIRVIVTFALPLFILIGCNSEPDAISTDDAGDSGMVALYQKNRGVRLPDEVRTKLGVALAEVREQPFIAIPESAIIQGIEGDFVYVQSGEHFVRTLVVSGAKQAGWMEIKDGLLPGDKVVASGAHDLWMIELLALRGGSPCCPAPKKGRKPSHG